MPKIKRTSLSQSISDILRSRIISGDIAVGQHLNEAIIAEEMGVSRGPVREALSVLMSEGLVIKNPNGRSVAAGFGAKDIQSYYKLRFFIESEAVRQIIGQFGEEEHAQLIEKLTDILERSRQYIDADDINYTELDNEFHLTILQSTKQKVYIHIWMILSNLSSSIMELNRNYIRKEQLHDAEKTYAYHDNILKGLKTKDLEYTVDQLKTHFENGYDVYCKIVDRVSAQYKNAGEN